MRIPCFNIEPELLNEITGQARISVDAKTFSKTTAPRQNKKNKLTRSDPACRINLQLTGNRVEDQVKH